MTQFEETYTRKINIAAFLLLLVHLPVLVCLAMFEGSPVAVTAIAATLLLLGPGLVLAKAPASPLGAIVSAVSAMGMSALAIYVTNGMIEAHFELFVLIALLTVYGRIAPLVVAGATIALHHVVFWFWLPSGIFNYRAAFSIVLVHAFFVVMEVVPACWIAHQFGKSIQARALVAEYLGGVAEHVSESSREISHASDQLASAATTQASNGAGNDRVQWGVAGDVDCGGGARPAIRRAYAGDAHQL